MKKVLFLGLVFVLFAVQALQAQEPVQPSSRVISFSGTIPGQPDGPVGLRFRLFAAPVGGAFLFEETQTRNVSGEKFTAFVGDGTGGGIATSIFEGNPSLWIAFSLDTDPDTEIGARASITSSGYAHFALGVPDNAVTTTNIQDSAITSAKIAAGSVDGSKIVDGSIGASHVDSTQVQRRVIGSCDVGNAIRVINDAGTVTCEPTGGGGGIGGSGTANSIPKFTGTTTIGNSAISEVGGDVGIGTTTPGAKLHVNGNLRVESGFSHGSAGLFDIDAPFVPGGRLRILENGNVGIGTTAPTARLHVAGGNVNLDNSTATTGNILKGGAPFIHNFGTDNFFAGVNAGNLTLSPGPGGSNTGVGINALRSLTTGDSNTACGRSALFSNTTGNSNTACGRSALFFNTGSRNTACGDFALFNNTGSNNTASGADALLGNTIGINNTAIGFASNVSAGNLTNATAIGANAVVNASHKIRLGNNLVTVIEGQVPFTSVSDRNQKENFKPVDREEVLKKIRHIPVQSWNYIGHDPKEFRHYGPVAQDFFAAFGNDGIGTIGTPTTINSDDMAGILMIAVQTLEKRTETLKEKEAEIAELKARVEALERLVKATQTARSEPK